MYIPLPSLFKKKFCLDEKLADFLSLSSSSPHPAMDISAQQGVRKAHDPNIQFEEYLYYAKESRAWEDSPANAPKLGLKARGHTFKKVFNRKERSSEVIIGHEDLQHAETKVAAGNSTEKTHGIEKTAEPPISGGPVSTSSVSDEEWTQAARAAKTATWGAVFFLLTTDILGPFSVP
jgi:hypothetical protein